MPLYEYRCDTCGDVFEVIQKFSDEPLATHEGCGGHVERLLSAPSFQFKGTGWYVTDYGRKNASNGSGNGPHGGSKAESKTESKTESKSDTKADTKAGSGAKDSKTTATPASKDK